jgi:hypothetical protein
MKTYRWLITGVCLIWVFTAQAQTYAFKVLVSKGKTEVKSAEGWSSIKVGSNLNVSDEVKVSENSYLGLMHASGKPLEVKDAGNYNLADLASKLSKGSTVLNKYTDFILSSDQEKRNKLSATGAVHRDLPGPVGVDLPRTSDHYGDQVAITWHTHIEDPSATVVVMDLGEEELARYKVEGKNSWMVNMNDQRLAESPQLMFKVIASNGNESNNYTIKRLKGAKKTEIESAWNEVSSSFSEKSALEKYLEAGFFEDHLMLTDALTAYKQAADMAPDVELYKEAYEQYVLRLGLKGK